MSKLRMYLGWLRRRPGQIKNDFKTVQAIKAGSNDKKRIYYFGVPEHSNLGDLAQCYCIRRFLAKYFADYEVVEIFTRNYMDNSFGLRDFLRNSIKADDVIFFQSGYCTQDIGGREDFMHQMVIQDYPNNKMVMLPQTVYFQSDERKHQASLVYNRHQNLLFLARDQVSYRLALQMFPDITVECYPDIVTTLIGHYDYGFERKGVLFCIRNDAEKFYSDDDIKMLEDYFGKKEPCKRLDTTIDVKPDKLHANLKEYLERYFKEFAQYKLVITDRYHGTIFALIANTPVIVIQTKDHKVKTGVDWFKEHYHNQVVFAPTLEAVISEADKMLAGHSYARNAAYFESEYYETLRKKTGI